MRFEVEVDHAFNALSHIWLLESRKEDCLVKFANLSTRKIK